MRRCTWREAVSVVSACLALAAAAPPARACGADTDCVVETGSYRIRLPDADEGAAPAAALVYLHGYRGGPEEIMRFAALQTASNELGAALIVPRGEDGSWALPGVWREGRDEVAFVVAVVEDAVERFDLDPERVMVSGFSLGASLAWYVACAEGRRFAGYITIAGSFWLPYPTSCAGPPPEVRHVHGTADDMVPMEGRALSFATQGDTRASFGLLRGEGGCGRELGPVRPVEGGLRCERATCGGAAQELCLHDGGHSVNPAWIVRAWRDIEGDGAADAEASVR